MIIVYDHHYQAIWIGSTLRGLDSGVVRHAEVLGCLTYEHGEKSMADTTYNF